MTGLSVVRFERLRRGIKAKEVAEAAGLTPPKYRFFERGEKYRGLSESALAGISAYLGVPQDMLADTNGNARMLA